MATRTREDILEEILYVLDYEVGSSKTHDEIGLTDTRMTLGLDSLDELEFIVSLEEEFRITITDEEATKCETIGDVVDLVERMING